MSARVVGLCISPGRSSTASIAEMLRARPDVVARHETLTELVTRPAEYFRAYREPEYQGLARSPAVASLVDEIEALPPDVAFVDVGWTMYPLLGYFADRFPGRLRVLHVCRHPVLTAASYTLHGLYDPHSVPLAPERFASHEQPGSPRVFDPIGKREWASYSTFERNLWRVVQIHKIGLEFERRFPKVPLHRLRVEEFDGRTPGEILKAYDLALSDVPAAMPRVNETKRLMRGARSVGSEWRRALEKPWARSSIEELGYDASPSSTHLEERMARYRRSGALEHLAGFVYRLPVLRSMWRTMRDAVASRP